MLLAITGKSHFSASELELPPAFLQSKVATFTQATLPTRAALRDEIRRYQELWHQVMREVPFEVHTNMVVVQGQRIKKRMLRLCEAIVELLVLAAYEYLLKRNMACYTEAVKLLDMVSVQIDDSAKLVEIEAVIDRVLRVDYARLVKEHRELVSWLIFLYD